PTRTPSTSVMALRIPGANTPGAMPRSRARGFVCAPATTINAETAETAERYFQNDLCVFRTCQADWSAVARGAKVEALRDRGERRLEFCVTCSCLFMIAAPPPAPTVDRVAPAPRRGASTPPSAFSQRNRCHPQVRGRH